MFRKVRLTLALFFWLGVTLLFMDFTGIAQHYLGWMAKVQFLPAVLALNILVILALIILTLLMGRVYCSVVCPLGVMQDFIAWVSKHQLFRKNKRAKLANRYNYSPEKKFMRWSALIFFVVLMVLGLNSAAVLIAPYSAYGRIATNLMQPIYLWFNNQAAAVAEHYDNYTFYSVETYFHGAISLGVSITTLLVIGILAWRSGRTWCNTICPVGTLLGAFSRFSLFRMQIDEERCSGCTLCNRNCKASCIDLDHLKIDGSRCVVCGDCIDVCKSGAMDYRFWRFWKRNGKSPQSTPDEVKPLDNLKKTQNRKSEEHQKGDVSRREFVSLLALTATAAATAQVEKTTDGGLAIIEDKVAPHRETSLTPPGSLSARNFYQHCTACQLCIAECPNHVLRPSSSMAHLMTPEMEYERGYCRPECNNCSQVCPTGAIRPITIEERTATQIGHAVWIKENCIPVADGKPCGNCARHCPAAAIIMVPLDKTLTQNDDMQWMDKNGNILKSNEILMVPAIDAEFCIGCGACENLCPARPFSAIYVEGHANHKEI